MEKFLPQLARCRLFRDIEVKDITVMLQCIGGQLQSFKKQEILLLAGDAVDSLGIILQGSAQIIQEDITGSRTIMDDLAAGDIFAETMACLGLSHSPFSVIALEDGAYVKISFNRILKNCDSTCTFHYRLVRNMMLLMAEKNWHLRKKVELLSLKTTREKLMHFFLDQARKTGSRRFKLAFTRGELADFLSVDRSAMSRELGRMQQDGLIAIDRRNVEILHSL